MSDHTSFMAVAYQEALTSYQQGGLPIGSVLVRNGAIVAKGHNQRVQKSDPIAHGEMDCLRNAGRQHSYRDTVVYTTLSPCMMCAGTIVQFKIPVVVIGDSVNFSGNKEFLLGRGVRVVDLNDTRCIELMERFMREKPELWNEDIAAE
jgi:cytosine/creatinine deaminase